MGIWFSRRLSLKGRAEASPSTSSPWSFTDWLYFLCLSHVGWHCDDPSPDFSGEVQARWSVYRSASNVHTTGSGHAWSGEPLAGWKTCILGPILDRGRSVETKCESDFSSPQADPKAEGRRKPLGEAQFVRVTFRNLLGSSDLSRPRKELYRGLEVGSASDPLSERRGWTAEEIRSHRNWAPGSSFLNNSEFSVTWWLVQNALPLLGLNYKAGLADTPDCARCGSGLEETAEHASGRLASNPNYSCCSTLVTL